MYISTSKTPMIEKNKSFLLTLQEHVAALWNVTGSMNDNIFKDLSI